MKNLSKLLVVFVFFISSFGIVFNGCSISKTNSLAAAQISATSPTPQANSNANTANAANVANGNASATSANANKTIPKEFVLSKDSINEYGDSPFNHDNHAFKNYSPDGKTVVGCVECHHTDQPKSALKPPLATSERDVTLTMAVFQSSSAKVSGCRTCHFQEGNVPEGKEMAKAIFTKDGKEDTKEYNNEIAYHINCNTCHDAAFKLRPELKKSPGFATSKDCNTCHKTQ